MTPSLCGSFLTNKRSLVAFTWTLTTLFTILAFVVCTSMVIQLHTYSKRMEHYYEEQQEAAENGEDGEEHNSGDKEKYDRLMNLTKMESGSMAFTAAYTFMLAMGLILYGSTTIVGFTSLRGVYIAPCFSTPSPWKLGLFGGAIVVFANMLLVCAVIFGEVRVEDWREYEYRNGGGDDNNNNREREENEPYEIEKIATVLAVTCMFLAALYSIFAILLFLYYGSRDSNDDDEIEVPISKPMPSIANDPRRENFITMGGQS